MTAKLDRRDRDRRLRGVAPLRGRAGGKPPRYVAKTAPLGLALVLAGFFAPAVLAQTAAPDTLDDAAKEGASALARGLFLIAVEKGAQGALDLAGDALSPEMKRALEAAAASPRRADVTECDEPALKKSFLKKLVEETPGAQDGQKKLVEDTAVKLARDLDDLVRRSRVHRDEARKLALSSQAGEVSSVAAIEAGKGKAGPTGPLLGRLARAAPHLARALRRADDAALRYRLLEHAFDRPEDAEVEKLLHLAFVVEERAQAALKVATGGELTKLVAAIQAKLDRSREDTLAAIEDATRAVIAARRTELKLVAAGSRGTDLDPALRMWNAYKRAFGGIPTIEPSEVAGVYTDRNDGRLLFYLEGEDRWVKGSEHAADPAPVGKLLLEAKDPALSRRAVDARAIAALYTAFGDERFEKGFQDLLAAAQAVCARARSLQARALAAGATVEDVDAFFAERAGYDRELAGPREGLDDAACVRAAGERFALAVVEAGPGGSAGRQLLRTLERARDALEKTDLLAFSGIKLEAPALAPGSEVALKLRARMLKAKPLVAPPERLVAGGSARCVLVVLPGEDAQGAALEAEARGAGGEPLSGHFELPVAAARAASGLVEGGTLALAPGHALLLEGPRGNVVTAGERLTARIRPSGPIFLRARSPSGREEPLPPGRERSAIEPSPYWEPGAWTAVAVDSDGKPLAEAPFVVEAASALACEDSTGKRVRAVKPGDTVSVRFLKAGTPIASGKAEVFLEQEGGGGVLDAAGAAPALALAIPSSLAPGRYRVAGRLDGAQLASWPLAVVAADPRVALVRDSFSLAEAGSVAAGEKLAARLEPGFALEPDEVVFVSAELHPPGGGPALAARSVPWPGFPARGLVVPLALKDSAPPGKWEVAFSVATLHGDLEAKTTFDVVASSALPLFLGPLEPVRGSPEDEKTAEKVAFVARGDSAFVHMGGTAPVGTASFYLVGPDGLSRFLPENDRGTIAVVVSTTDPLGAWEIRGLARSETGTRRGTFSFTVYEPSSFEVKVQGKPGQNVTVDVPLPEGLVEPVSSQVGGGAWVQGAKGLTFLVDKSGSDVPIVVRDKRGRRAEGRARIELVKPAEPPPRKTVEGPAFGIVANVRERKLFYPSFISLEQLEKSGTMDKDWVVLDEGPLAAAETRDRTFELAPFDGLPAVGANAVYRSKRIWEKLAPEAAARIVALGCDRGTVFDVTNSPSPGGEETLQAVLARHLDAQGGWVYELHHVSVLAQGAYPDRGAPIRGKELHIEALSYGRVDFQNTHRVVVPGTLADLALRADFPEKLVLGENFVVTASTAAVSTAIVPGRTYPGGLEKLAARGAILNAVSLEGTFEIEGQTTNVSGAPVLDKARAGAELVFHAIHGKTERADVVGKPRTKESYVVTSVPRGTPEKLEPGLEPVPPGQLDNKPRRVVARVKAKLSIAVSPSDWPKEQTTSDIPRATVGGAPFLLDPVLELPKVEVELEATYLRTAADCAPPRDPVAPAIGDVLVTRDDPSELAPIDARSELEAALQAAKDGKAEAYEAHARAAVMAAPTSPEAWSALGDAVLSRKREEDAVVPLSHAAYLAPESGRVLVLLAEAQFGCGHMKEARDAAKIARGKKLDDELRDRLSKLFGE